MKDSNKERKKDRQKVREEKTEGGRTTSKKAHKMVWSDRKERRLAQLKTK